MTMLYAVRYDEESESWVSYSFFHDVYSQGNTRDEALLALDSAVQMHLRAQLDDRSN